MPPLSPTKKQSGVSSHGRYPLPEESSHRVGRGRCVVDGMAIIGLLLHTLYHFRLLPAIGLSPTGLWHLDLTKVPRTVMMKSGSEPSCTVTP
jgi:hypothetical protein